MKIAFFLFIPIIFISSCSTSGSNKIESLKMQTGISNKEETVHSGEIIQYLGNGFFRKGCSLTLDDVAVDSYSVMGCDPSEADIEKSIAANIPHDITIGNVHIQAPDSLRVTSTKTYFTDFALYAQNMKDTFIALLVQENSQNTFSQKEIDAEVENFKGHYSFETKKINGFDALIHKRDFYEVKGQIYQVFIFAGNDQIMELYEDSYPQKLDNALKTLKK